MRLIDSNGEMIGIVSISQAMSLAEAQGLDLIEISPNAEPPVCRICSFGKFKYEIKRKAHDAKKKQKIVEIKEIKLRPNIGQNDYDVKLKSIQKFITEGDKVKITLRFRGREITHHEIGMQLMSKLQEDTLSIAKTELLPRMDGKQIMMVLAPKT
ncbi:Translation initiation factor IF-3 [Rickettsiales bacterium Ac37b]|nr:Translation initiation factor IF-3 [Rickettsiales bacterium Ac37b]